MVTIIEGIDLDKDIEKYDAILVGTNSYCVMGSGIQAKIRKKYPFVYDLNLSTKYGDKSKLGCRVTTKGTIPLFSLCFIVYGYNFRPDIVNDYLDYSALEKCIKTANNEFSGLNVATTFIGCSKFDGNGDKDKVMKILNENTDKINLFVYDYEQYSRPIERSINYGILKKKYSDKDEFYSALTEQKNETIGLLQFEEIKGRKKRLKKEIIELLKK